MLPLARNVPADAPDGTDLVAVLDGLRSLRAPYEQLLRATVADILAKYPVLDGMPLVEIGSGIGQLRGWLPDRERGATLHTDPNHGALRALRRGAPDARAAMARAQSSPLRDGCCGGVLGLCVFDALGGRAEQEATVAELARILAPGARFVHFMDMGTLLDKYLVTFNEDGLVPIPNVYGDPDDHEWPLDVILFDRNWLEHILLFTQEVGHPLFQTFGPYFAAFILQPFDREEALRRFKALAGDGVAQRLLALHSASAFYAAAQRGYPVVPAVPFHSGLNFSTTMASLFERGGHFERELNGLVTRSVVARAGTDDLVRYRSLCVGHERIAEQLPKRLLAAEARDRFATSSIPAGHMLIEAGVFVFVARRAAVPS